MLSSIVLPLSEQFIVRQLVAYEEPVRAPMDRGEIRVFIKVYAKEGRLPSDLTKAKIDEQVLAQCQRRVLS
jgi:hypothetical protein